MNNIINLIKIDLSGSDSNAPLPPIPIVPVEDIILDITTLIIHEGDDPVQINATILPLNATNKSVIWSTSIPGIVDVTDGLITPLSEGSTTIIASTFDGGFVATCQVRIGATSVWQRDPDWWDIMTFIQNDPDVANYPAVRIVLIVANEQTLSFTSGTSGDNPAMIKTSDGFTYNDSASHYWNTPQDKQHSLGYATRYIIEYYAVDTITKNLPENVIYCVYSKGFINHDFMSLPLLQSFDFIEGSNFSPLKTNFNATFYGDISLVRLPDNINTSYGINFTNTWNGCRSLPSLPKNLDLSNGTTFVQTFIYDDSLTYLPANINMSNGQGFHSCFYGCTTLMNLPKDIHNAYQLDNMLIGCTSILAINITQLNVPLDISNSKFISIEVLENWGRNIIPPNSGTVTITMGPTLLNLLSNEGKALFTDKNYILQ